MNRIVLACLALVVLWQAPANAQEPMLQVLGDTLARTPAPGAVWSVSYTDPVYPLQGQHPGFDVVRLESESGVDYVIVRSSLLVIDREQQSVSCFFVFLPDGTSWPGSVQTASGSSVVLTSPLETAVSLEQVQARVKRAEDLLLRYSSLQDLTSLQLSAGAFVYAGIFALLQYVFRPLVSPGVADPEGDRTVGGICIGLGAVGVALGLGGVGELVEMGRIRGQIRDLWD